MVQCLANAKKSMLTMVPRGLAAPSLGQTRKIQPIEAVVVRKDWLRFQKRWRGEALVGAPALALYLATKLKRLGGLEGAGPAGLCCLNAKKTTEGQACGWPAVEYPG